MGADLKKAPPLPAPTESESFDTPTELATDISKPAEDERSSYSLPDDGTPVTIKTRGHRSNKSQTSLLIEYFEGGKNGQGGSHERKPSVRVRLTPSKAHGKNDRIQITETRSTRGASNNWNATASLADRSELEMTDPEDARSMNSYASATEESNVSRNPIEVEIDPGSSRRRNRKVSSPLIPTADSKVSSYLPPEDMSDISAIPTNSFLDGSGGNGNNIVTKDEKRAKSPLRLDAGALGVASVAEKLNRKSRTEREEVDKPSKQERRTKVRSRANSVNEKEAEARNSAARRKSRGSHKESLVSAADSSVLSSHSHRSYDSYSSSKVSINNPKLLETVEDAIRRLILPELDAIKRERSQRDSKSSSKHRDSLQRDSLSSLTSASRDELSVTSKRKSADTTQSTKSKDRRNREARNEISPQSSLDEVSVLEEEVHDDDHTPRRDHARLRDIALGAGGAAAVDAALRSKSRVDEKRQRRRRRADHPKRDHHEVYQDDFDEAEHEVAPPMPLSSEINPSEMTRTSILSAETDRPHSASEEMTPVREVPRGVASEDSMHDTPTPTRSPAHTLQHLGAQHANVSHGDLKALPRKGISGYQEEAEAEFSRQHLDPVRDEYDEYDDEGRLTESGMYEDEEDPNQSFFGHQDVPAPLRYVPYQQERRGLSPIQSVSGFTEGESDIQGHRDSRITQTASELSSPAKSTHHERGFADEESSVRSSGLDYRNTTYTEDSELDQVASGQAVRNVSGNAQMVHREFGPESAVASLIEGSGIDPSLLSGSANGAHHYDSSQISYDEAGKAADSRDISPTKQSADSRRDLAENHHESSPASASREVLEYDVNEYGQKVPLTKERQSPTASEAAITSAALGRAAAAALKRQNAVHHSPSREKNNEDFTGEGVSRNRSFKERTKGRYVPDARPRHSVDRLSDYDQPKLGASGLPDMDNPIPEIGYGYDEHSDLHTPSVVQERLGTPTGQDDHPYDRAVTPKASRSNAQGAMAASHSRQPSQEHDVEWHRTSSERKRDTLVTNPYEGASPIANLPGLDGLHATGFGADSYRGGFHTGSPGLGGGDEGYISAAPNDGANIKGKGIGMNEQQAMTNVEDPFYSGKHGRHLSGMSQGLGSPLYDSATGTGIDRIQSKDIIALMEHLMVRDAQRSARDTEILVTLVRSAAEMRNSFEDIKRILADTEEQIILETRDNTEKTVKRHLGGPRPLPGSSGRSIQGGSQVDTFNDMPAKKRSFLRRALQGLSAKGTSDLARIEDMLNQLLTDVDDLKHQSAGGPGNDMSPRSPSGMNIQPDMSYEQDKGYEPEGNAGTSTASHASQSGHLSIPQPRGSSSKQGYERKISDHRISTVPEDNEDDFEDTYVTATNPYSPQGGRLTPGGGIPRGGSVPLATPPQTATQQNTSHSQENTPRTDDSKRHKSRGSSSFFPKISRWSETTTSSIGKVFRTSGNSRKQEEYIQHSHSRSGSQLGDYDYPPNDPYGEDKLHTGFSTQDLPAATMSQNVPNTPAAQAPAPPNAYTPEDPKFKAHRNSLNLQHPQPRPGQTERFRTALEYSAQDYDSPMSPGSADWAGSATSLHRFPAQNTQRYSDNSAMNSGQGGDEYNWASSPAAQGPPRPPKEPLDSPANIASTPPQHVRVSQLQEKRHSPLPFHSVESGYGTSATHAGSHRSTSPKPENRNLSAALGVPTRRPSGPRAMTPTDGDAEERRRKRDTFGTVASPRSAASPRSPRSLASQESETF